MKKHVVRFIFVIPFFMLLSGCRGDKSSAPPIAIIRNMDQQTSYGPQSTNEFFKDKRAARDPVSGTVAEDDAHTNLSLYYGILPNSSLQKPVWLTKYPLVLTKELLKRGQDRYNIYCAPCHGYAANNDGLVTTAAGGSIRPANIHSKEVIALPVGKIYDVVTNGVNNWNMPGFSEQMSVQDRWAVVAYVRALQISQQATINDVPKNLK